MTKKQTTIITFLSIVAFILAFLVTNNLWFRLDLTKTRAHTISKVTRNLHAEIEDYVNITYYLSDKLRSTIPVAGEIEDMLREIAAYSKGKIRVRTSDPLKADLSARVEELGLQPRQVQTVEQDQASFVTVYSGIVIEYLDKTEVLPWVISTDTLEYDITSRVRALVSDSERRIGVIVGDSFRQWREDFSILQRTLSDAGYAVRLIAAGEEIPDNLPALFVFGGVEDLDDWALYRIDRYIQIGGRVLFAVKGIFVDTVSGSIEARNQNDIGLLQMIASYGVIVRPELVLDRSALNLQYQRQLPTGAVQFRIIRYPLWIGVLQNNGNSEHPVSAGFSGLDLYWASPLELAAPASVTAATLFTSTTEAWIMKEQFNTSPETPAYLFETDAAETRGTKILGASLTGEFPSFFRGSPKPSPSGTSGEELQGSSLPDMPNAARASRIIVIGDTDFATNMMNATNAAQNLDFLLSAADWLASDDDIITIRNRQPNAGRLDKITDPDNRAAVMRFVQIVNTALIPLAVIAAGLLLSRRRKIRSRRTSCASAAKNSKENIDAV